MRRISAHTICSCLFVLSLIGSCCAQVTTGTPAFGSFGGGPFDTVSLGNLNVHFAVPIVHKAGRGLPFHYDLTYDASVWYPVGVSGTQTWQPVLNWGWMAEWGDTTGYITYATGGYYCYDGQGHPNGHTEVISNFIYVDPSGVSHAFAGQWVFYSQTGTCIGTNITSFTSNAADGSGLTLNAINGGTTTITTPGAQVLIPPLNPNGSSVPTTVTDANGNQITSNTGGVFTDTLGDTALTVTGSAPSPLNFAYTAAAGSENIVLSYVGYAIKTNFGCSGIAEYTSTSNISMVDKITLADGTFYQFSYEPTPGNSGYYTGRLASVTLPTGGKIIYAYSGGNNGIICSDGSAAGLSRTLKVNSNDPGALWTYTRSLVSGAHWQTTITTPPDPQNSGSASNNTVLDFQKDSASNSTNNFYETQRQAYQGTTTSGTLLRTTVTCYNGNTSACTTTAVSTPISQTAATIKFPNNGLQAETGASYNSYGLPTAVNQYAYGSGAPGALIQNTQFNYASLGNGIVDHPSAVLIYDGSSNLLSETAYAYDEPAYPLQATSGTPSHISISGSRGNATTITSYSSVSASLVKHFEYFDTGNVYQSYDVNGAITTYNYPDSTSTCGNSFPTSVSLPVNSLSTSTTWNCIGAVATKLTDVNGQSTILAYTKDVLSWRPDSSTDPASNLTTFTYTSTTAESLLAFNSNASVAERLATVDGFGRVMLNQRQQGYNSSNYDSAQTSYDTFGRPSQVTMPYAGMKGQGTSTAPSTTTIYDALNRPTKTTDAGNGYVSYTYSQNDVLQAIGPPPAGESKKQKQLEYDALGRLISVCELTQGTGYVPCAQTASYNGYMTKYVYDYSGGYTRVTVTQNAQTGSTQTRTYLYDLLGRLVSETNPENATTTYTFDSASGCSGSYSGDLVKRVDAAGNTTCYSYDALHRVTSASYSGPNSTPAKNFVYDAATVNGVVMGNTKGRLAEAYTGTSGSKITDIGFVYSVRGELIETWESTPHSGGYYHPTAAYWANGALETLWMSGLPSMTYGVEGEGRTSTVSASSGQNPVTGVTYTNSGTTQPIGSLAKVTFGSGDSDNFTYDVSTGRMTQYKYTVSTNSEIGNLGWNANGSLGSLGITDPFNASDAQNCTYTHDDLARIGSVSCGSVWAQTFNYDPFGNISKSGSSSYLPTYLTASNQIQSVGGVNVSYDADGNILHDGFHTYTWDAEGKMISIDSTTVVYDALNRMAEQNQSGTYFQVVYSPLGKKLAMMKAQVIQQAFVPLPGQATAEYLSWGLSHYRHADWVGSSRLESSTTHAILQDTAYAPFGEPYSQLSGGNGEISFTGQNKDTAWLNYDFMYREHDPRAGRWISPDPAGLSAVNMATPQSWNRYAYVMNNPLAYIDPDGTTDCNAALCDKNGNPVIVYDTVTVTATTDPVPITTVTTQNTISNPDPTGVSAGPGGVGGGGSSGGGVAANNGILSLRKPGQSVSQCLQQNMGNFSLVGIADKVLGTNARDTFLGNLVGGNDVTGVASIFTGDDPTGSLASAVSVSAENGLKNGIGTPLRIGGNTAPAFQTLFPRLGRPAQALLRSKGLSTALGTIADVLDFKLEADVVLSAALLVACR